MSTGERRDRRGLPRHRRLLDRRLSSQILLLAILDSFVLSAPLAEAQLFLSIEMQDVFAFDPGMFSADPGANVTIQLLNDGALQHPFTL